MADETVIINFIGNAEGLKKVIDSVDKELGQLVVQTNKAQKSLGAGLGKGAQQAATQLVKTSKAVTVATKRMNQFTVAQNRTMKTSGQMRANIQNLGFQIQDIAVQAEMGTNAMRIMGQQGSQILGIFGPGGALAGAGLAIAGAILAPMITASEETEKLTDRADDLGAALVALGDATLASQEFRTEPNQQGSLADQIMTGMLEKETRAAEKALNDFGASITANMQTMGDRGMFGSQFINARNLIDDMEAIESMYDRMMKNSRTTGAGSVPFMPDSEGQRIMKEYRDELELFNETYNISYFEVNRLTDALKNMEDVAGDMRGRRGQLVPEFVMKDQVEALADLEATLRPMKDDSEQMRTFWEETVNALHLAKTQLDLMNDGRAEAGTAARETAEADARDAHFVGEANDLLKEQLELRAQGLGYLLDQTSAASAAATTMSAEQRKAKEDLEASVEQANTLREEIGNAAVQALLLSDVNMAEPISAAAREAAILAGNLGIVYERAQEIVLSRATNGGMDGARGRAGNLRDNSEWGVPGGSIPKHLLPDKGRKGGGGGRGDQTDPLEKIRQELELAKELRDLTDERAELLRKLGEDRNNYTEQQLANVEAMIAAENQYQEAMKQREELGDFMQNQLEQGFMAIIDGTKSVEDAFKDMAKAVLQELWRVFVMQKIVGSVGGGGIVGAIFPSAKGNVFDGGNVVPFAQGGVVNSPTLFPMSGGKTGLMGESGAEAIMPLQRNSSGDLGVAGPAININNYSGQPVTVDRSEESINIAVGKAVQQSEAKFQQSMSSGQGGYARALEGNYSARRKAV